MSLFFMLSLLSAPREFYTRSTDVIIKSAWMFSRGLGCFHLLFYWVLHGEYWCEPPKGWDVLHPTGMFAYCFTVGVKADLGLILHRGLVNPTCILCGEYWCKHPKSLDVLQAGRMFSYCFTVGASLHQLRTFSNCYHIANRIYDLLCVTVVNVQPPWWTYIGVWTFTIFPLQEFY